METGIVILGIICFLLLLRNNYTFFICGKANKIINEYTSTLINVGEYNCSIHYYQEMQINYFVYLFSFWKWRVIDMIKPKYRDQILYILEENKHVKKRTF